jgi:hypothetical protein
MPVTPWIRFQQAHETTPRAQRCERKKLPAFSFETHSPRASAIRSPRAHRELTPHRNARGRECRRDLRTGKKEFSRAPLAGLFPQQAAGNCCVRALQWTPTFEGVRCDQAVHAHDSHVLFFF